MTDEQKSLLADKVRRSEMIACVEKLKVMCRMEGDCEHGCPFAEYYGLGKHDCTLLQLDGFSDLNDCREWNIKKWRDAK